MTVTPHPQPLSKILERGAAETSKVLPLHALSTAIERELEGEVLRPIYLHND
jgi:hypothetical protein